MFLVGFVELYIKILFRNLPQKQTLQVGKKEKFRSEGLIYLKCDE